MPIKPQMSRSGFILAMAFLLTLAGQAAAQLPAGRTIDEIREESIARSEHGGYPLIGLAPSDVREAFTAADLAALQIDPALPVVALRIPLVGELSRKEREENHPLFDLKKGAKATVEYTITAKTVEVKAEKGKK